MHFMDVFKPLVFLRLILIVIKDFGQFLDMSYYKFEDALLLTKFHIR